MQLRTAILIAFAVGSLLPWTAQAEGNLVCLGYNPETKTWGDLGVRKNYDGPSNCPANHAFVATSREFGPKRTGEFIGLFGSCCPLPEDVLLDQHIFVSEECPENHVATGAQLSEAGNEKCKDASEEECIADWQNLKQLMRCTKINTNRYLLASPKPSLAWGWQPHFSTLFEEKTSKSRMPLSLRHGIGRLSRTSWNREGCVAFPWGSLIVKKSSKYCSGFYSRELLYAGADGDPVRGAPVRYYADCGAIQDPLSPEGACIP